MTEATHTLEQLRAGVDTPTENRFTALIERKPIDVVEIEDVNFHFNSAVLLPAPPGEGPQSPSQSRVTGLSVIAVAILHAEATPGPKLLIAGHTDSVGSAGANRGLSQRRADNVHAYLQGDAARWSQGCAHHMVEDYQLILRWIADEHGIDCSPGLVDGIAGPNTRRALNDFRAEFNRNHAGSLPTSGAIAPADWEAFFKFYDLSLADLLEVEPDSLASKRSAIVFMEPATLACGEDFPVDKVGYDNVRSEINRRVELLFIDDAAAPNFSQEVPPGRSIYGSPARYTRTYIEVEGLGLFKFSI